MSVRSDITQAMRWHRYESKMPQITVTDAAGDPIDLRTKDLRWRLLREAGSSTVLLEKTDITVTGDDNNVAVINIDFDEYDEIPADVYAHELRDATDHQLLTEGDAWLLPGSPPSEGEA